MKKHLTDLSLILMMVAFFSVGVFSQTTEFTYQGDLQSDGKVTTPVTEAPSAQINIPGGVGSFAFGLDVVVLPNGNFVVTDYGYSEGGVQSIGAVRLYDGATLAIISTLKGSTQGDQVGGSNTPITVLTGGNHFVVVSSSWNNGGTTQVGAVTLCSAVTGCSGTVTPANSLIGSTAVDVVGSAGIIPLTNGNYVVRSQNWHNTSPAATTAGAVTFCNAATNSCAGQVVSASNSIVGSTDGDNVGGNVSGNLITTLPNGNFFFRSPTWHNGSEAEAGAVTWCSGTTGCAGVLSSANSIVGTRAFDRVGNSPDTYGKTAPTVLANGNFVIGTPGWDNTAAANSAGAATFCSGTTGCAGEISASNSLVSTNPNDLVSYGGITALADGNYVVSSHAWDYGTENSAGAVTWCSGTTGCVGGITIDNSLLGGTANDNVGVVTALTNGNYVVSSHVAGASDTGVVIFCSGPTGGPNSCQGAVPFPNSNGLSGSSPFDNVGRIVSALPNGNFIVGSPNYGSTRGAVTWCSGTTGCAGDYVTDFNSLTGRVSGDNVGLPTGLLPFAGLGLANGDYVVTSWLWDNNGTADVGAVTLCNGTTNDCAGQVVSPANSLIGSTSGDFSTALRLSAFSNSNYVVRSEFWDGTASNVGAITFCNAAANSCAGQVVSASNSLVGSTSGDRIGGNTVTTLTNGNLVILSGGWNNGGSIPGAGAFTFCHAVTGCPTGTLSTTNSLTGTKTGDFGNVAASGVLVQALTNGNYVVQSAIWDNGSAIDAGVARWCNGTTGCVGPASASNSLVGSTSGDAAGGFNATVFPNGNYAVLASTWDIPPPGFLVNAGFATYCDGTNGTFGIPNAPANSARTVVGTTNVGVSPPPRFDPVNNQMIVSRVSSNIVTVLTFTSTTPTPTATPTNTATATSTNTPTGTATPTPTPSASISGTITYGNAIGSPAEPRFVKNVSLSSTSGSPAVGPVITGTPGTYALTGFGAGSYTVKPTKPGGANGAITSNDAARVAQGVSASVPFVSMNQKFASDASGNGTVSSNDAALIARFAAGLTGTGNVSQWKFFIADLPGPASGPLPTPPYNDSRSYASVTSNVAGEDYIALLVGEASGNWNPATHPRPANGPERSTAVELPQMTASTDKEMIIPVSVHGVAGKEIISYEFDLRYDPSVIEPLTEPVDVTGTVSRGLSVVANTTEPGLLRVVVYGALPIADDGVLLKLRFRAVGVSGSVSHLAFDRIMFNEGESHVATTDGKIELF